MPPLVLPSVWVPFLASRSAPPFSWLMGAADPGSRPVPVGPARPSASIERRFGRRTAARTRASVESALAGPSRARGSTRAPPSLVAADPAREKELAAGASALAIVRLDRARIVARRSRRVGCSPMGRPLHFRGSASGRSSRRPFPPTMATQPRSMVSRVLRGAGRRRALPRLHQHVRGQDLLHPERVDGRHAADRRPPLRQPLHLRADADFDRESAAAAAARSSTATSSSSARPRRPKSTWSSAASACRATQVEVIDKELYLNGKKVDDDGYTSHRDPRALPAPRRG